MRTLKDFSLSKGMFTKAACVLVLIVVSSGLSLADRVFNDPQVDGYGLDYCREWAQNCGKPAADAYCQSRGFNQAVDFSVVNDNQKTRIINGGQVCDADFCDRIVRVACQESIAVFNEPQISGYGLDYCREWAQNCGKPAADAYCQSRGFNQAVDFSVVNDNQKTRIINGGQVCDADFCDRISKVVCKY